MSKVIIIKRSLFDEHFSAVVFDQQPLSDPPLNPVDSLCERSMSRFSLENLRVWNSPWKIIPQ